MLVTSRINAMYRKDKFFCDDIMSCCSGNNYDEECEKEQDCHKDNESIYDHL